MKSLFNQEDIPEHFSDDESLVRGIFYPANFNRKDVLKKNMFMPPRGSNELSTIRLKYSSADRCKFHCKEQQKEKRNYWGLGVLNSLEIHSSNGCVLVKTPAKYEKYILPEHADIKLPLITPIKDNEPIPIEIDLIVDYLFRTARINQDPEPHTDIWNGNDLK